MPAQFIHKGLECYLLVYYVTSYAATSDQMENVVMDLWASS